ncbi:MAG: NADPH:quinone oxidoreductase [Acidimicrobiia bacterium]|nr:MAG: NADPH:quinone oxidoreductase [Acidimicrobiia bacterium]
MKAILCEKRGGLEDLRWADAPDPSPGPGEVVIDVRAAGVNFADLLMTQGLYQVRPPLPFSPGFEVCGTVTEIGVEVDGLRLGDRVVAFTGWGGYAERVKAQAGSVFPAPPGLSDTEAATFLVAYGTAYHALVDRAALRPSEVLVVLGASGGVGTAAVQLGRILDATVVAAVSSEEKAEFAHRMGASTVIRYDREDLKEAIRRVTDGRGADVVFDPVGGATTEQAFRALAWEGRLLVVGFAAGEIPGVPANLPLLKSASLVGVFWGAFAERRPDRVARQLELLASWVDQHGLRPPVTEVFPLSEAPQALRLVAERRVLGRLALTP